MKTNPVKKAPDPTKKAQDLVKIKAWNLLEKEVSGFEKN
jgi:hypothetical protein